MHHRSPRTNQGSAPCIEQAGPLQPLYTESIRFSLAMIRMLYCTWMSRSQVCGLHWSDIDFGRGTIVLRKAPGSSARHRIIPLDYGVEPDMLLLKEVTMALLGRHYSDREQVFRVQLFYFGFAGNWMSPDQVTDLLSRLTPDTSMTGSRYAAFSTGMRIWD